MKIAYFECRNGISGDMTISSLINAGVKPADLVRKIKSGLSKRDTGNWSLEENSFEKHHFPVTKINILGDRVFLNVSEISNTVRKSKLAAVIKENSLKVLSLLEDAENNIHKKKKPHLHQMGSLDTLIDVVGTCTALDMLKIEKIYSSPLNTGTLAPAAFHILKTGRIPVYSTNIDFELVTPTGAAIITALSGRFGPMPEIKISSYGFGLGNYSFEDSSADIPEQRVFGWELDMLKVVIGEKEQKYLEDNLILLETNIDDMDTRVYPFVIEKLIENGALDAWVENILMKKGRPAFALKALTGQEQEQDMLDVIFRETTTFGIRKSLVSRIKLDRITKGKYKTGILPDGKLKRQVEFREALRRKKSCKSPLYEILK